MDSAVLERPVETAAAGGYRPPAQAPGYSGNPGAGAPGYGNPGAGGYSGGGGTPAQYVAMDAETGIPAFGTQIQVLKTASPEDWATIAGVGDITGPNTAVAEIETTSHSTGSPHRTFIPTLIDDGELSFPNFWNPLDPTQSIDSTYGLEYLFQNRIVTKFRLINTDQGHRTRTFKGFVKTLGETYPVQGVCTRNVAIRITSVPTQVPSPIAMTPASASPLAAGGPGTFTVATGGAISAAWMPVSDSAWIHITAPTVPQTSDGSVSYTVDLNPASSPARTGHIMIAALGLTFAINQAAG